MGDVTGITTAHLPGSHPTLCTRMGMSGAMPPPLKVVHPEPALSISEAVSREGGFQVVQPKSRPSWVSIGLCRPCTTHCVIKLTCEPGWQRVGSNRIHTASGWLRKSVGIDGTA